MRGGFPRIKRNPNEAPPKPKLRKIVLNTVNKKTGRHVTGKIETTKKTVILPRSRSNMKYYTSRNGITYIKDPKGQLVTSPNIRKKIKFLTSSNNEQLSTALKLRPSLRQNTSKQKPLYMPMKLLPALYENSKQFEEGAKQSMLEQELSFKNIGSNNENVFIKPTQKSHNTRQALFTKRKELTNSLGNALSKKQKQPYIDYLKELKKTASRNTSTEIQRLIDTQDFYNLDFLQKQVKEIDTKMQQNSNRKKRFNNARSKLQPNATLSESSTNSGAPPSFLEQLQAIKLRPVTKNKANTGAQQPKQDTLAAIIKEKMEQQKREINDNSIA